MSIEIEVTPEMRYQIRRTLQSQLTTATEMVWHMQRVLSLECGPGAIARTSVLLADLARVILGEISRWNLMETGSDGAAKAHRENARIIDD